jgi:M6 family metalloprotease-like protein
MNKKITYVLLVLFFLVWISLSGVSTTLSDNTDDDEYLKLTTIMIDFPDKPHFKSVDEIWKNTYGTECESVHKFWNLASSGKQGVRPGDYQPDKWFRASKDINYYAQDTEDDMNIHMRELVREIFDQAVVDGLEVDMTDGYSYPGLEDRILWLNNPTICFVVAGQAEGYTNFPQQDRFWPVRWNLDISDETNDKKILLSFVLVTEDMSYYGGWSKVLSHEVGHLYGLADLYDYDCGGPYKDMEECDFPFTYYDIMVARHGGQGLTGLHREMLGWIEPEVIEGVGSYELTLPPVTTNDKSAYIKVPIAGTKEILGIEYRTQTGIDAFWEGIPSEGVIVYRINERSSYWDNTDRQRIGERYVELYNPRHAEWHDNPCYTSDDISVVGPDTNPSTKPRFNNHTEEVTITVLSEYSDEAKIRVDIEPRDHLNIKSPERVLAGHLHNRSIELTIENPLDRMLEIDGEILDYPIELGPNEKQTITTNVRIPEKHYGCYNFPLSIDFTFEDTEFSSVIILDNILAQLDFNWNGIIELSEIDAIFEQLGDTTADSPFDVDENGIIDMRDVVIIARYVGFDYD